MVCTVIDRKIVITEKPDKALVGGSMILNDLVGLRYTLPTEPIQKN